MKENIKNAGGVALKAGAWYVVSSIMVKAISIITTPIFTRLLSTAEYGTVSTFTSWHTLLLTFFTLNLTYSIGRAKLDFPGKLDDYVGSMQVLSAIVSACVVGLAIIFINPVSSFLELNRFQTILLLIYLFFEPAISFRQNCYRYKYQYKQNIAIAWYTALSTVFLALILIMNLDGDNATLRMIGITVPTVVLSVFFWIKSFKSRHLNCNRTYWKYGWSLSGPLILHTVSMNILSQSDRIFISKICGTSSTGIYSLAYNYGLLLNIITGAVSDGWLPWFHDTFFAEKFDEIKKNVKYIVVLGCYVGLACIALAPEAIKILGGDAYSEGVYCVPPIVLGIVCQYIYTHYVNIEMHMKKTKYVSMGTIFAAILNVVLNAIFIPKFGYVAASYTTLASYIALLFIHFTITRRILKVKLYNDVFMFGSMVVTAVVTIIITYSYSYTLVRYLLIGVGFITFVLVFRNFIISFVKKRFVKK